MMKSTAEGNGGGVLRRAILLLAVAAVMAAMVAASAMPAFAGTGSLNTYTCVNKTTGAPILNVSQALKQQFQTAGFKCTKDPVKRV